jgi:hypothetical protein
MPDPSYFFGTAFGVHSFDRRLLDEDKVGPSPSLPETQICGRQANLYFSPYATFQAAVTAGTQRTLQISSFNFWCESDPSIRL